MAGNEIGVCVVGAGTMGTQHAAGWQTVDGARIAAVVDLDEKRARTLAESSGADRWLTDYRKALTADDIDAVSVCTPAGVHPEVTVFAAEHGKHVLSEKPIALTLAEADRMIDTTRDCGVKLGIGFQLRFSAATAELASLIQGGKLGRPVMWRRNVSAPIRTVVGKPAMHDLAHGNGGPVVDFCPHTFDRWRKLFQAEAVSVVARGFTAAEERPELAEIERLAPDTAAILVEFSSGDLGVFTISWGLPPGASGGSMEDVLGPRGGVTVGGKELKLVTEGGQERVIPCPGAEEKAQEIRRFVQAVCQDGEPEATGADGRAALAISLAALESMERKEKVTLNGGASS